MQKLFIKSLKITVATPEKKFGTFLHFKEGLNVLRSEKSGGKSTCLNAILYALGLGKMLNREGAALLKPVLRKEVVYQGEACNVLESFVELEIRNATNQFLTLKRQIVGELDTNLIMVFQGAKLSRPYERFYQEQCYPVENQNGEQEKELFSTVLARFLNWNLPLVSTFQGDEVPLPLECVFSLLFIDQNHGWHLDQNILSAQFGIQHPRPAALEFLFNLDVSEIARKKRKLINAISELKCQWADLEFFFQGMAEQAGGKLSNFPKKPIISYDSHTPPAVLVSRQKNWVSLDKLVFSLKEEFSSLEKPQSIFWEDKADQALDGEISGLEKKYTQERLVLTEIRNSYFSEKEKFAFLQEKVSGLDGDLEAVQKKLEDIETESELDSVFPDGYGFLGEKKVPGFSSSNGTSDMTPSLKGKRDELDKQKEAAAVLLEAARKEMDKAGECFERKNLVVTELRKKLKNLQKSSQSDDEEIKRVQLRDLVHKKEKIREFETLIEKLDRKTVEIAKLSKRWKELLAEQAKLHKEYHSRDDKTKLKKFLSLMMENIREFGFSSTSIKKLKLSLESYHPVFEDMDLDYDLSASDSVRLLWGYTLALQNTALFFPVNHPRLTIFDEPAQQNIDFWSRKAFYLCLMNLDPSENQVLVTTSEDPETLKLLLGEKKDTFVDFGDKMITPMDD